MENSQSKYEEYLEKELEAAREKYAGCASVECATGDGVYDFSKIKPADIKFGIHGSEYIKAKARNFHTGAIGLCYLKYKHQTAEIL